MEIGKSHAYQPIVAADLRKVYGYEALVRGPAGESAFSILSKVTEANKYRFDHACRRQAIQTAAALGLNSRLHINFLPNAVYSPETCIRQTLALADACHFPLSSITFEITEGEKIHDLGHVLSILSHYKEMGFSTALDDFGDGYSGLNLLAEIQPDIVKLDMKLITGIDRDKVRRAIVRGIASVCEELEIMMIAEGVETIDECRYLLDQGITFQQGFFFARPGFETLPAPLFAGLD